MDEELKSHLGAMERRVVDDLSEKMRDMQSGMRRGFASFSQGQPLRVRNIETDRSNLDASLRGRVNVVEDRLRQIELRLGLGS